MVAVSEQRVNFFGYCAVENRRPRHFFHCRTSGAFQQIQERTSQVLSACGPDETCGRVPGSITFSQRFDKVFRTLQYQSVVTVDEILNYIERIRPQDAFTMDSSPKNTFSAPVGSLAFTASS